MDVCVEKGSGSMIVNPTLEHGDEDKHLLPPSSYFDTLLLL